MKNFNMILLVVGMCSITMYGSQENDRSGYWAVPSYSGESVDHLDRFDFRHLQTMSCEELRDLRVKSIDLMIYGSAEERNRIFSPRKNSAIIDAEVSAVSNKLAGLITATPSPETVLAAVNECTANSNTYKKKTCMSSFLKHFGCKRNTVYVAN